MPREQKHGVALITGASSGIGATYEKLVGIEAVAPRSARA
jgi:short-subunit dehydrogenase